VRPTRASRPPSHSSNGPNNVEGLSQADKMVRRAVSRREISVLLVGGEVIEVDEHESRVRYVLFAKVDGRPLHLVVAEDDILDRRTLGVRA
jgi:hypothetical protein